MGEHPQGDRAEAGERLRQDDAFHPPAQCGRDCGSHAHDFYVGDRVMYVNALASGKAMFTEDGRMPEGGPENVLAVLSRIGSRVRDKPIDLAGTYSTEFVDAANARQ